MAPRKIIRNRSAFEIAIIGVFLLLVTGVVVMLVKDGLEKRRSAELRREGFHQYEEAAQENTLSAYVDFLRRFSFHPESERAIRQIVRLSQDMPLHWSTQELSLIHFRTKALLHDNVARICWLDRSFSTDLDSTLKRLNSLDSAEVIHQYFRIDYLREPNYPRPNGSWWTTLPITSTWENNAIQNGKYDWGRIRSISVRHFALMPKRRGFMFVDTSKLGGSPAVSAKQIGRNYTVDLEPVYSHGVYSRNSDGTALAPTLASALAKAAIYNPIRLRDQGNWLKILSIVLDYLGAEPEANTMMFLKQIDIAGTICFELSHDGGLSDSSFVNSRNSSVTSEITASIKDYSTTMSFVEPSDPAEWINMPSFDFAECRNTEEATHLRKSYLTLLEKVSQLNSLDLDQENRDQLQSLYDYAYKRYAEWLERPREVC